MDVVVFVVIFAVVVVESLTGQFEGDAVFIVVGDVVVMMGRDAGGGGGGGGERQDELVT